MKRARCLVVLLGLLSAGPELHAQVIYPFVPGGYAVGRGFGVTYTGRRLMVSGYLSSSYYGPGVYPGFGWGYPAYPYYGFPTSNITIFYSPPPVASTPIVINQPIVVGGAADVERDDGRLLRIVPRARPAVEEPPPPAPREEPPLPGRPAGNFRPIDPKERARAQQPMLPEAPKAPPKPKAPDVPKDQGPRPVVQGKEALASQEYGRAERLFEQATRLFPNEAMNYFLLAQARFARAKYREAVDAIQLGMRLKLDWPHTRFRARDLYGANGDDFNDHLSRLEETLARHPQDPSLLFLYAHQLWFDGRQDEAWELFVRAAKVTPDKLFIDRFLRAKPGLPVAKS